MSIDGNWRSIEGNCTIYWRKLDVLSKETVRSIDGNWTIYWRKLDVLLTETGRSIDENCMVNWRKECILLMETVQQIFFIFGTWKCDLCRVLKSMVSGTPSILLLIFSILEVRKCQCCRVVKPKISRVRRFMLANFPHFGSLKVRFLTIRESNDSRYLSKSRNFLFFEGWKCGYVESWNPRFKGTKPRVSKFSACWLTENAISSDSWNQCFKVPC